MKSDPAYAEGVLVNAYARIPSNFWSFTDVATDNAVSNDPTDAFRMMASGQWTSSNNPIDQWTGCRAAIQYINIFLERADDVKWAEDEKANELFKRRMRGEAYGLRGLFMYYLLRSHAGWTQSKGGELLGVPIVLHSQTADSSFNKNEKRATFEACMKQIYSDLDSAISLLPPIYGDLASQTDLPKGFTDKELGEYNRVFGNNGRQRMSGLIAMAIRAKASLLAASPAYQSPNNTTTWEDAANYAGDVLKINGGVSGLAANGETWYSNASVMNNIAGGSNPPEILWRGDINANTDLEQQNFPPTLFGKGEINPSENLVDAFPMQNGYPINNPDSHYDPDVPYSGRVPLLAKYIVVNGSAEGPQNNTINTASDGNTNDALNRVSTSTRTGYYMRKLLRMDVSVDPALTNSQLHYKPRIRYTEIYLDYAEAANEAWGPTGTGSFSFSAYDIIGAIRKREGIDQPDLYLESVKSDKDAMRKVIRNTRRIELCFEDFRFWDLRRWNESITDPAMGDKIIDGKHNAFTVEGRNYKDYMRFGPIPKEEVLKFPTLIQNYGWN
jgi:hypothetical protein